MAAASVTGTIVLPDGSVLPDSAEVSVEIQDTSRADALALTVGQSTFTVTDPSVTEVPFEVAYDPADIKDAFTYTLNVRIEDEAGDLSFTNDTATPVITNGAPTSDVVVEVIDINA